MHEKCGLPVFTDMSSAIIEFQNTQITPLESAAALALETRARPKRIHLDLFCTNLTEFVHAATHFFVGGLWQDLVIPCVMDTTVMARR